MRFSTAYFVSLLVAFLPIVAALAAGGNRDLTELSLEELTRIEVTSVSRKEEPLADAAAAVAVITNEAIRRYGARTIPEALRLVPGLHVAQVTSSAWGVSARGFSSVNSAKLLVLSDSRSIYTPLFSGVFWYVQDLLLEDIDRVEVIRGPGASLWGANAVNGVINITSKSARDTQGAYFEGGSGTTERGFGAVRYGGDLAPGLWFRVFAQGFDRAGEFGSLWGAASRAVRIPVAMEAAGVFGGGKEPRAEPSPRVPRRDRDGAGVLREDRRQVLRRDAMSRPSLTGRRTWAAGIACALTVGTAQVAASEGPSEYEVKAAFLFNFAKYVEWPEGAFPGPADRIVICVLGENPFGTLLEDVVKDKKVNGRELAVRETRSISAAAGCHIVFIAFSEQSRLEEILRRLGDHPVLTVSDGGAVADRGVILGLTLSEDRVRFEVNLIAARRAGLKLSSQLLKVAIRLIGQGEEGAR